MILEAFARHLQSADPAMPATEILASWLYERLTNPAKDTIDKVLHTELSIQAVSHSSKNMFKSPLPNHVFIANSDSGKRLLKALYEYAHSWEQQKWSRWIHGVKASDFNKESDNDP